MTTLPGTATRPCDGRCVWSSTRRSRPAAREQQGRLRSASAASSRATPLRLPPTRTCSPAPRSTAASSSASRATKSSRRSSTSPSSCPRLSRPCAAPRRPREPPSWLWERCVGLLMYFVRLCGGMCAALCVLANLGTVKKQRTTFRHLREEITTRDMTALHAS